MTIIVKNSIMQSKTKSKEKRACLECSAALLGRADKKFCCAECRSSYHNKSNYETNKLIRDINRLLKRNYAILKACKQFNSSEIEYNELLMRQYNFNFATTLCTDENGNAAYFCYDLGYVQISDDHVRIIDYADIN